MRHTGREEDIKVALLDQKRLARDHLVAHSRLYDWAIAAGDGIWQIGEISDQQPVLRKAFSEALQEERRFGRDEVRFGQVWRER